MSIGCETAAIDRWVAPAYEPIEKCRRCDHEIDYHDQYGCYAIEPHRQEDHVWVDGCECEGFE